MTRSPGLRRTLGLAGGLLSLLATAWLTACSGESNPPTGTAVISTSPLPGGEDATVRRVVDGDTLIVEPDRRVRLIGIDTPETVSPRTPVECFGPEASSALSGLLPPGTLVRMESDRERFDRFDRELAYIYRVDDGTFINATLVAGGFADVLEVAPNTRYADTFGALRAQAQASELGLWGACR